MRHSRLWPVVCLLMLCVNSLWAQKGERYADLMTPQTRSGKVGGPEHMQNYVADGKLRLSLRDAIVLTLENNSDVRIQEGQVEASKFSLLGAHWRFDPVISSTGSIIAQISPPLIALPSQATGGLDFNFKDTTKNLEFGYSQVFETGTTLLTTFSSAVSSTNNSFSVFNPSTFSSLNFSLTQPLLKGGWLTANRAALVIARRNLQGSKATFAAEVNNNVLEAIKQYWDVVEAHGNLDVARASMDAAESTYKRNKRELELGALPPLDIYLSESRVASRRVQAIQAEYRLKEAEDTLRQTIGADQVPLFQALDLQLTEKPEPEGELLTIDALTAMQKAVAKRPEFDVAKSALARDEAQIQFARNQLLPQLDLQVQYASTGLGGTTGISGTGTPISSSWVNQLFGFGYPIYQAQLTLSLPLKNRAAKAEMGVALVSRRNDLYGERREREQVLLEVNNAVHQLEQAKLTIVAGKEALDLAQKNASAEQRKYELGARTIFFVLDAQTELAQSQQTLLQAQVGYQRAVAAIDHSTGELLEPYHLQLADLTH